MPQGQPGILTMAQQLDHCSCGEGEKTSTTSTFFHHPEIDPRVETVRTWKWQESKHYALPGQYWELFFELEKVSLLSDSDVVADEDYCNERSALPDYLNWRRQMVEWFMEVARDSQFQTETIEVAINMVDRFMAYSPRGNSIMIHPEEYRLVCMACFYTASKTSEQECISSDHILQFSGDVCDKEHFVALELEILSILQWRLNPPTRMAFVRVLLDIIPDSMILSDRTRIARIAEEQILICLTEVSFVSTKPSIVAFAALMNAIQFCQPISRSEDRSFQVHGLLRNVLGISNCTSLSYDQYLERIQEELYLLIAFDIDENGSNEMKCNSNRNTTQSGALDVDDLALVVSAMAA